MISARQVGQLIRACAVGACVVLSACSNEDPATFVNNAKAAMEKRDFNTAAIEIKNALQIDGQNAETRYLFGRVLLEQGDAPSAERELRKAAELRYSADEVTPLLARSLIESGQAKKAIEEFASIRLSSPSGKARLASALGDAYLVSNDNAKAVASFDAALANDPKLASARLGKAKLQFLANDIPGALKAAEAVLSEDPHNVEALIVKAEMLAAQDKIAEAIEVFQSAVKARPGDLRAYERVVMLNLRANKQKEADEALAALKKVHPNHPQTVYLEGVVALRANRMDLARDAAAKVLRVAPEHPPSLVLGATANMRLGDHLQAQTMLQKVIISSPQWVAPRKLLAESLVAQRSPDEALEVLRPLMTPGANDPDVLNIAGQAFLLKGDYAKSTDSFTRLANLRPENAGARVNLALARLASGDETRAMQDLEIASKMDSARVQAELALIAAYLRKGDTTKALQAVAALEKKQPNHPLTFNVKGQALLAAKDVKGARAAFERGLELQPGNLSAAVQLARLDVAEKKVPEARKRFENIIEKEPKNIRAFVLLAQLQAETGATPKEVQTTLEKAVNADPTRNEARVALIQLLLNTGDNKAALNVAQQASAAQPDSTEVLQLLGRTQVVVGERQQAVSTLNKLHSLQPQNPGPLVELADVQRAMGDAGAAEQSLKRALDIKPDLVDAQQRLGILYLQDKRLDAALKLANLVQQQRPQSPAGFVIEADVHAMENRWPEAVASLQKAYALGKTPQLVARLHAALSEQGKQADARKVTSEWISSNPKDIFVRSYLADVAMKAKRYPEAMEHYKAVVAVDPRSPVAWNNMAWIANQQKDRKAVEYAEAALKAAPRSPAVMETVGTVLVANGQTQRGLVLLKDAAAQAPQSPEIKLGYARGLASTGDKGTAKKEAEAALDLAKNSPELKAEIEAFANTL